jgi:hypothetical protein
MPASIAPRKLPPVPWAWTTSGQPPAGIAVLGTVSAKHTARSAWAIGSPLPSTAIAPPSAGRS